MPYRMLLPVVLASLLTPTVYADDLLCGDVNNDASLNVLDVVTMVSAVLGTNDKPLDCPDIEALCQSSSDDASAEPTLALPAGVTTLEFQQDVEGVVETRIAYLVAPDTIDTNRRYPLLFALHGHGGHATQWIAQGNLTALVEEGHFVAVLPQGLVTDDKMGECCTTSWNLGLGGGEESQADDVAFVGMIHEQLAVYENLNMNATYAIGSSNGSAMNNSLAVMTDYFAGIVNMASQLVVGQTPNTFGPTPQRTVVQLHGMDDSVIPYEKDSAMGYEYLSAENSAQLWADHNGCSSVPRETTTAEGHKRLDWLDCDGSTRVVHYGVPCADHSPPSGFPIRSKCIG